MTRCPYCGATREVTAESPAGKIQCPSCAHSFVVRAAEPPTKRAPAPAAKPPTQRSAVPIEIENHPPSPGRSPKPLIFGIVAGLVVVVGAAAVYLLVLRRPAARFMARELLATLPAVLKRIPTANGFELAYYDLQSLSKDLTVKNWVWADIGKKLNLVPATFVAERVHSLYAFVGFGGWGFAENPIFFLGSSYTAEEMKELLKKWGFSKDPARKDEVFEKLESSDTGTKAYATLLDGLLVVGTAPLDDFLKTEPAKTGANDPIVAELLKHAPGGDVVFLRKRAEGAIPQDVAMEVGLPTVPGPSGFPGMTSASIADGKGRLVTRARFLMNNAQEAEGAAERAKKSIAEAELREGLEVISIRAEGKFAVMEFASERPR